ncbi:MAG: hypothetical protein GXP29_13870, partial [Planctomycetes bacterium]|nr:hypothetical protein [Planctomycetota bacterium]
MIGKTKRGFGVLACGLALLVSASSVRAESLNPLTAVPGEAWASLTIRNLGDLDNKLIALGQRLNAPMPGSPLEMLKAQLQLTGLNTDGGAAIVMMPFVGAPDPQNSMAILIPCADYAAMTANMALEPAVDGVSRCMLMGTEESYIAQMGGYAVLGPKAAGVQSLLATKGKPTIGSTWTKHQLTRFAQDDATLHLNLKAIVASPMVQGMLPMLAASGSFNPADLNDLDSIAVSVRLGQEGLNVGFYSGSIEGSPSAKLLQTLKPTTDSLLTGLPGGNYLLAFGMRGSQQSFSKGAESYKAMLANPMLAMAIQADPAKMQEVAGL